MEYVTTTMKYVTATTETAVFKFMQGFGTFVIRIQTQLYNYLIIPRTASYQGLLQVKSWMLTHNFFIINY